MNNRVNHLLLNERGGSLVEFVLIAPILLILLFGIIEFGLLLYNQAIITNASREGARAGIVYDFDDHGTEANPDDDTYHPDDSVITAAVRNYCQDYLITFGSGTLNVPAPVRGGDEAGDPLTVSAEFHYDFLVLPGFISALIDGIDLDAFTVMRLE